MTESITVESCLAELREITMTETILDEGAVSEIEGMDHAEMCGDALYCNCGKVVRDQLCDTVKHLRWQVDLCEKAFELDSALKLSEVGDLNALQIVRKMADLQSQLEQLRAENERLISTIKKLGHNAADGTGICFCEADDRVFGHSQRCGSIRGIVSR